MDKDLEQFAHSIAEAENLEQLTRPMLALLENITHLESTYLTTIDEDAGYQKILYALNTGELNLPEGLEVPWSDTLCKRALEARQFLTRDVPAVWGDSDAARELGLKTYLSTAVYTDDGELFGTLCGASKSSVDLDPRVSEVLELFSRLIAQQATREKLAEQNRARALAAEKRASEMQLIAQIGALCLSSPDLETLLENLTVSFETREFWVSGVAFTAETGINILGRAQHDHKALIEQMLLLARTQTGYIPSFVRVSEADELTRTRATAAGISDSSLLYLMAVASGTHLQGGVLLIGSDEKISESEKAMVQSCWQTLTLYAERNYEHQLLEAANAMLTLHARHDPLTELPNRRYLVQEMKRMLPHAARNDEIAYVAFIDLDGFKKINDTYGHDVGDDFLCEIADRLRGVARRGDLAARYGGDEFVLFATNHKKQTDNAELAIAARISKALSGTIKLPSVTIDYKGPSVGVVSWQGSEPIDADILLARADKAMYIEKMLRRAAR